MRRYLAGFAVAAMLLVGLGAVMQSIIPLDGRKPEIAQAVANLTGRNLTISGPLSLSLFPKLEIEAHGIAFANPPGGVYPSMVKAETVKVEFKLLPLLRGRLEIARFVLRKPEIDLEVAASGVPNWVFPPGAPSAATGDGNRGTAAGSALGRLAIAQLHIDKGTLRYENKRDGTSETITNVTADLSLPGAAGPLAISGNGTAQNQRYSVDLAGDVSIAPTVVRIDNAKFRIDSVAGTGALAFDTGGGRPRITGGVTVHRLDLNPYLAPPVRQKAVAVNRLKWPNIVATPTVEAGWDDAAIDFSGLTRLDADLSLAADEIRLRKLDLGASALHVTLANGQLQVAVTGLSAYGGRGTGFFDLRGVGAGATVTGNFRLIGIQILPLLNDGAGFRRLSGNASWTTNFSTIGDSQRLLIANLQGTGALELVNGSIRGVNLLDMLANPLLDRSRPDGQTNIEHLTGSYVIAAGIVTNHDLMIKSGNLTARGDGTVDLPRRAVDYRLTPNKLGLSIPIQITGPWGSLHYRMPVGKPLDALSNGIEKPVTGLRRLFRLN